jgi:NAD(P)H-hydrate epimerase
VGNVAADFQSAEFGKAELCRHEERGDAMLSRDESRALDRRAIDLFGVPGVVLMENAGRGMAELLRALGVRGAVVVCCGGGNNGGDGFVIARHLDNAGVRVRVHLFAAPEELKGDAAVNYRVLLGTDAAVTAHTGEQVPETLAAELATADWVVDALVGSGQRGPLRPPLDGVAAAINASGARVLAVDIPSGLDCDTGQPLGPATVRAHHTATVAAPKKGFAGPGAAAWLGCVHVIDMGAPRKAWQPPAS